GVHQGRGPVVALAVDVRVVRQQQFNDRQAVLRGRVAEDAEAFPVHAVRIDSPDQQGFHRGGVFPLDGGQQGGRIGRRQGRAPYRRRLADGGWFTRGGRLAGGGRRPGAGNR